MINRLLSPVRVDIVLNHDCNHKCLHCYNPWRKMEISKREFQKDIFNKIDIIVKELKKANVWSAILTGGEPLLHPDILFYTIEKFNDLGISMSLNSNLTLITDDIAKALVEKYDWSNIILTSLPSINKECCDEITQIKGSYERILKGIEICKRNGIRVGINTVITKKNIDDLNEYIDFIKIHNIDYVSISTVIPPSYDSLNPNYYLNNQDIINIADKLLEIKDKCKIEIGSVTPLPLCILKDANRYLPVLDTTCMAGISKCTIEVESGKVFACAHEEESYGNIYRDGLEKCWEKMERWANENNIYKECSRCKWLYLCGGECRMQRNGTRRKPDYELDRNADIKFEFDDKMLSIPFPNENDKLKIYPNLKIRKEKFGALVRANFIETNISYSLLKFCEILQQKDYFTITDLKNLIENYDDIKPIIMTLLQRGIILNEGNDINGVY